MQKIYDVIWMELNLMDQEYPESNREKSIRIVRIIDANDENSDLEQEVNKLTHLTKFQRVILPSCLKLHKDIFDGNIGE